MKKLASLTGVKTLGRTAQKSVNGGGVQSCPAGSKRRRGICGDSCSFAGGGFPCAGEVVNGVCYICV